MLLSHSQTARRLGVFALLVVASFASLTAWLGSAYAFPPPGGGGGPPADPAIAFIDSGGTSNKLKVMNADGSNRTTIYTAPPGVSMYTPIWSPAGDAIVFARDTRLWLIDVAVVNGVPLGSNPQLLSGPDGVSQPAWSPLGDEIAYYTGPPTNAIQVVPATGGAATVLFDAADDERVLGPTWSADGTRIAFPHRDATGPHIRIIDRSTLAVTTVLTLGPEWSIAFLDWARTSDTLALILAPFVAGPAMGSIYTLDIHSGVLTFVAEDCRFPSWSPNDTRIVFTRWSTNRLARVEVSTGTITQYSFNGLWPDWRRY